MPPVAEKAAPSRFLDASSFVAWVFSLEVSNRQPAPLICFPQPVTRREGERVSQPGTTSPRPSRSAGKATRRRETR